MKYCPECGAPMEDDDIFCLSCGASFEEENKVSSNKATTYRKRKVRLRPVITIVVIIALLTGAVLYILRTPCMIFSKAAYGTINDIKGTETYDIIERITEGDSLELSVGLSEILNGIAYLDLVDAKASAKLYFDVGQSSVILKAGASVNGASAIDADLWLTPMQAVIHSGTFLGQQSYGVELSPLYERSATPYILSDIVSKLSENPDKNFAKLWLYSFIYGESEKTESEGPTVVKLTLDRKSAEKALSKALNLEEELPADFLLRLRFVINENSRLTAVALYNDYCSYVLSIEPDTEHISAITLSFESNLYYADIKCKIKEATEDAVDYKFILSLNNEEISDCEIKWNRKSDGCKILIGDSEILPDMKLRISSGDSSPLIPEQLKIIDPAKEEDIYELSGTLDKYIGELLSELGYVIPFSLQDMIFETVNDAVYEYTPALLGSDAITMTERELEEYTRQISEAAASEVAEQIAREVAEETARTVTAEAAIKAVNDALSKHNNQSAYITVPTQNTDTNTIKSDKNMLTKVAGNYTYREGKYMGISSGATLDNKGNYYFSVSSLFFNISDSGTYTIDRKGNMVFDNKLGYDISGQYVDGKIHLVVAGLAEVDLEKE